MSRNRYGLTWGWTLFALATFSLFTVAITHAGVPQLINLQAQLSDSTGVPVPDGIHTAVFTIYDAGSGGTALWSSGPQTGQITNACFDYMLGADVALPPDLFADTARWLGVQIDSDPEIQPRIRLVSVPYALQALRSDTAAVALSGVGGTNGWTDNGSVVCLQTPTDKVGIGTDTPQFKLTLEDDGGILATGGYGFGTVFSGDTAFASIGSKFLWYPRKAAFRAGYFGGPTWEDAQIGELSVALGHGAEAPGGSSFAAGIAALAGGLGSIALGDHATAGGTDGIGIGRYVTAGGDYSLALGRYVTAGGENAIVLGSGASFSERLVNGSPNSLAVGFESTTPTLFVNSTSVGIGTNTPTFKLSLEGDGGIVAKGSFGTGTTVAQTDIGPKLLWYPRKAAFRVGYETSDNWSDANIGDASLAAGNITKASGDFASALGTNSTASGHAATAIGDHAIAAGYASVALGSYATASANYSLAIGDYVTAGAENSIALGCGSGSGFRLVNGVANSLAIGFKSTSPTVFVNGTGMGIGSTNPAEHKLYIESDGSRVPGCNAYIKNTSPTGIAMTCENESDDATLVLLQHGTGDVMRCFRIEPDQSWHYAFRVTQDGWAIADYLQLTGGSDLSEQFDVRGSTDILDPEPGMVVCIDPEHPGELKVSAEAYDRRVAGIISGAGGVAPGMLMGQQGSIADGDNPVALTGRVYCWADADGGAIEPGDMLTTANTPGHAMKVADYTRAHGAVIGKAMTPLESGRGLVLVLVTLQ